MGDKLEIIGANDTQDIKQILKTSEDGQMSADTVLKQIQKIDTTEKQLYANLEQIVSDINSMNQELVQIKNKPDQEANKQILNQNINNLEKVQEQIILQIKQLASDRTKLYQDLGNEYVNLQAIVTQSQQDLIDQRTVAGVMDSELTNIETETKNLLEERNRKMKLVEIDTYYSKRYKSYTELMKIIAYSCIPILAVVILFKMELINKNIRSFMLLTIFVISGYFIGRKSLDIYFRDNMNWDEYRFIQKTPKKDDGSVWDYDKAQLEKLEKAFAPDLDKDVKSLLGIDCSDEGCCNHPDGKVKWDKKKKECVVSHPLDNKHKETFNNLMNLSQTKSEVSPFVDLEGPIHSKVKNGSLGSKVNESCSIANIDNLNHNFTEDNTTAVKGFDGF
jgi:hypothetical protein